MRYVLLLYGDRDGEAKLTPEERRAIVDEHIRFSERLSASGALVLSEPLEGSAGAFAVRRDEDGAVVVTDGPFTETKEQLGSFYLVECATRDDAVAISCSVPPSPGLVVEVWPVAEI